jgi:hypothetical protein
MTSMKVGRFLLIVSFCLMLVAPAGGAEGDDEESEKLLGLSYDEGFRLGSADAAFFLRINGLLQLRYTYVDYDPTIRDNDTDYSNFYVRRARLYFMGHAFDPKFSYFFHIQLEPTRTVNAHDLWIEYEFSDLLRLGAGRMKISYGLEFLNSGAGLGMVERSIFSGETDIDAGPPDRSGPRYPGGGTERFGLTWAAETGFATGGLNPYRSQGVQLRGHRGSATTSTFEYQLGVWQGRSTLGLSNSGTDHLYSVRVGYHPWGFIDWRWMGDPEGTRRVKIGVIGSAYTNRGDGGGGYSEHAWDVAAMLRYRGLSADLEWATEVFDYQLEGDEFERSGWRVELGWFVLPPKLELRARYATVDRLRDPTYRTAVASGLGIAEVGGGDGRTPAIERSIMEMSVGVNYFINQWHRHKLQFDASRLKRSFAADPDAIVNGILTPIAQAPDQLDWRVRAMVQLTF